MGYEVRGGKYVLLSKDEIDAAAGERSHLIELEQFVGADRDRSGLLRPHLLPGRRGTTGRTPTGCCTTRWSAPSASGSAAGCFTTASTSSRSAPFDDGARAAHDAVRRRARRCRQARHPQAEPRAEQARDRDGRASSSTRCTSDFDPTRSRTATASACRADRAQGRGRGARAARARGAQRRPTDLMAALEASLGQRAEAQGEALIDAALAVDRVAELRAGQRPGRRGHRPCATSICTSASCTRRTAPRSRCSGGARRRTSRFRSRRSPAATSSTTASQVIVSDLELEAIEPRRTRTIEIEQFVDLDEVDPIYFDHPYFLVPAADDDGSAPRLPAAHRGDGRTDRAALGRFVMRAKEYLAIVRARDGRADADHDAVRRRGPADQGRRRATGKAHKPTAQAARRRDGGDRGAVGRLGPGHATRTAYRARLQRVVDRKRKGETIEPPEQIQAPEPAPDLMAALEQTLQEMTDGGSGRWSEARERQEA